MRRSVVILLGGLGASTVGACSLDTVNCSPSIASAVAVVVRDSLTDSLVVDSALGIVIGAAGPDTMFRGPILQFGDSVLVGGTQAGVVSVQVQRPGYQTWLVNGVHTRLSGGDCPAFITTVLTARMQL
jgi:hypothetical protein